MKLNQSQGTFAALVRALLRKVPIAGTRALPPGLALDYLMWRHGTDKRDHGFCEPYAHHFAEWRSKSVRILEIGVGGHADAHRGGASLRTWRDFFPNGQIIGLDYYDKSPHSGSRITILRGDQSDPVSLTEIVGPLAPFDIIIDDGSHVNSHVLATLAALFPLVSARGVYVIEDIETAYWPSHGGYTSGRHPGTTLWAVYDFIDSMNYQFIPNRTPRPFDGHVAALHCYPNVVFVEKAPTRLRLLSDEMEVMAREASTTADPGGSTNSG